MRMLPLRVLDSPWPCANSDSTSCSRQGADRWVKGAQGRKPRGVHVPRAGGRVPVAMRRHATPRPPVAAWLAARQQGTARTCIFSFTASRRLASGPVAARMAVTVLRMYLHVEAGRGAGACSDTAPALPSCHFGFQQRQALQGLLPTCATRLEHSEWCQGSPEKRDADLGPCRQGGRCKASGFHGQRRGGHARNIIAIRAGGLQVPHQLKDQDDPGLSDGHWRDVTVPCTTSQVGSTP